MALKIRLRRMGRKKAPHYRIVIAESSMPRDGRFVTTIGHYNPTTTPVMLKVDRDKALAWMEKGAMPTDTVQALLKKAGVFSEPSTTVETVTAAVTEVAGKAASAVAGAAGKTSSAVKGAAAKAASAAASVAGAAAGAASAVAEAASGAVETVADKARDVAEEVTERVSGSESENETKTADAPAE